MAEKGEAGGAKACRNRRDRHWPRCQTHETAIPMAQRPPPQKSQTALSLYSPSTVYYNLSALPGAKERCPPPRVLPLLSTWNWTFFSTCCCPPRAVVNAWTPSQDLLNQETRSPCRPMPTISTHELCHPDTEALRI